MRTSTSQFYLLVDFMERNGDLSKPTEGPQGRASNIKSWAELTETLNSDASGDTKTTEKWRKVWSDLKNNTKKKAARIHRAAIGTGGGPAFKLKLSDLEQRILSIVGSQAATGIIEINEIGLDQEHIEQTLTVVQILSEPSTSTQGTTSQLLLEETEAPHLSLAARNDPAANNVLPIPTIRMEQTVELEPLPSPPVTSGPADGQNLQTSCTSVTQQQQPSHIPTPSTPRRVRRPLLRGMASPSRGRTRTQTQSELARQAFVNSDSEWRALQREQQRENVRLRERELQQQQQWLDLLGQFIGLGNRYMNYLEKK